MGSIGSQPATETTAPLPGSAAGLTDAEVMLRVKAGDESAFEYLVQKYRRAMVSFMYRMSHNAAAAEDLAQEVFLRVYRSRTGYEASAKFTTWLYRIATNLAVNHARDGGGPTLIECKTYRTRAHAEGMIDFGYRTRQEVEQWKTRCPIESFKSYLLKNQIANAAELAGIDESIEAVVEEAHKFAESSPMPPRESAATHVFADPIPEGSENCQKAESARVETASSPQPSPARGEGA